MFERYTEAARRAIFYARREAARLGAPEIRSEHLLLGTFGDGPVATHLLKPAPPKSIREQIEQEHPPTHEPDQADAQLNDECKRILAYAAEEADLLQEQQISTEHLILGVLREFRCYASELLSHNGVSAASVRTQIESMRRDPSVLDTSIRPDGSPDARWTALGIPEGYAWPKLIYNPPSETLIVHMQGARNFALPPRLFMKHKDAPLYVQIGDPDEATAYQNPATPLGKPLLAFNVNTWNVHEESVSSDWKELRVISLPSGELVHSLKNGELDLPQDAKRCWINELLGISDDGNRIYVIAGLESPQNIRYVVALLSLTSRRLEPVTILRGTFF